MVTILEGVRFTRSFPFSGADDSLQSADLRNNRPICRTVNTPDARRPSRPQALWGANYLGLEAVKRSMNEFISTLRDFLVRVEVNCCGVSAGFSRKRSERPLEDTPPKYHRDPRILSNRLPSTKN